MSIPDFPAPIGSLGALIPTQLDGRKSEGAATGRARFIPPTLKNAGESGLLEGINRFSRKKAPVAGHADKV
jgi:hypothetical protein